MSAATLAILYAGRRVGELSRARATDRLKLSYDAAWRGSPQAMPLSISLPLGVAAHRHETVDAYLWGLLPDNERVLDRWSKQHHVSARSAFSLLSVVGEDCASAFQFARPERVEALAPGPALEVAWIDEAEIEARLRELRADQAAWSRATDEGQFSLAGAQPKMALLFLEGRWGVPRGRTPTTHILKPPLKEFDGHAENEHFCLQLARRLGLPTATTEVKRFGDETAIVVERFDRVLVERPGAERVPLRIHQEDLCQALGLRPTMKYQNEGGPSPARIVELLRGYSVRPDEDVRTFVDALAFNWLIGGTDAHAKNYALLHGGRGQIRLAPLYDVASALPYDTAEQKLKLAMKFGGTYRMKDIRRSDVEKLAEELRLPSEVTLDRMLGMADEMAASVIELRSQAASDGLTHPILDRLSKRLSERARECAKLLRGK